MTGPALSFFIASPPAPSPPAEGQGDALGVRALPARAPGERQNQADRDSRTDTVIPPSQGCQMTDVESERVNSCLQSREDAGEIKVVVWKCAIGAPLFYLLFFFFLID